MIKRFFCAFLMCFCMCILPFGLAYALIDCPDDNVSYIFIGDADYNKFTSILLSGDTAYCTACDGPGEQGDAYNYRRYTYPVCICDTGSGYMFDDGNGENSCVCNESKGWVNDDNGGCKCDIHSLKNSNTNACDCETGYLRNGDNKCLSCDTTNGYGTYGDNGECKKCSNIEGNYYVKDGVCEQCPIGHKTNEKGNGCVNTNSEAYESDGKCKTTNGYGHLAGDTECFKCVDRGYSLSGEICSCDGGSVDDDRKCTCSADGYVRQIKNGTTAVCTCSADGYAIVGGTCTKCGDGYTANSDHSACICGAAGYVSEGDNCDCKADGYALIDGECKKCSDNGPGYIANGDHNACICGAAGYHKESSLCVMCPMNTYSEKSTNDNESCNHCGEAESSAPGASGCTKISGGECGYMGRNSACNTGTYSTSGMACEQTDDEKWNKGQTNLMYFPLVNPDYFAAFSKDSLMGVLRTFCLGENSTNDRIRNFLIKDTTLTWNGEKKTFFESDIEKFKLIELMEQFYEKFSGNDQKYVRVWIDYIMSNFDGRGNVKTNQYISCNNFYSSNNATPVVVPGKCEKCGSGLTTSGIGKTQCDLYTEINKYCIPTANQGDVCFDIDKPWLEMGDISSSIRP